jgi:hypothetical protein
MQALGTIAGIIILSVLYFGACEPRRDAQGDRHRSSCEIIQCDSPIGYGDPLDHQYEGNETP